MLDSEEPEERGSAVAVLEDHRGVGALPVSGAGAQALDEPPERTSARIRPVPELAVSDRRVDAVTVQSPYGLDQRPGHLTSFRRFRDA
jgi:hypothetical protein